MTEVAELERVCRDLAARADRASDWDTARALYLEIPALLGRVQGAVSEASREHPDSPVSGEANAALEEMKAAARQVGLDMRLSSPAALQIGIQTVIQDALAVLALLKSA